MANTATKPKMTLQEFLAWDAEQPEAWEFYDGQPWLKDFDPVTGMAGGTSAHALLSQNIGGMLRDRLRGGVCRSLAGNARIIAAGHAHVPDASVVCRPLRPGELEISDPSLVCEVLSTSTERIDRGTKWPDFQTIPSLQACLLVSQEAVLVDTYIRRAEGGWIYQRFEGLDAVVPIAPLGIELPLAELYEGMPFAGSDTV